ncbi:MAG: SHD1 domain-containing protein [Planctomycetales bacterium]
MKVLLSGLLSITVLSLVLFAAEGGKSKRLSVGDKVQVKWAGESYPGEVQGVLSNGFVKVKFTRNGMEMTQTVSPDKVSAKGKGDSAKGTAKGSDKDAATPSDKNGAKSKPSAGAKTAAGKFRTWSDRSGKFSVKAKFISLADDQVTLQREDGRKVTLAIDKLKEEDQKVARQLAEEADENPFEPKEENPFEATDSDGDSGDAGNEEISGGDDAELVSEVQWGSAEPLTVSEPDGWSLAPDAAPVLDKPLLSKPLMLFSALKGKGKGAELGFFDGVDSVLFDRAHGAACVVTIDGQPGQEVAVRVQRADLIDGKAGAPQRLSAPLKPTDVSPSGRRILARSDFHVRRGQEKPPELSVWEFSDQGLRRRRGWNPVDPDNFHKSEPGYAKFIDDDHVVTVSFPSRMVIWDVPKARPKFKLELATGGVPALSANRKYLAVPVQSGIYLINPLTGKTLGKLPGDPGTISAISFNPQGTQLAALSVQRLQVWNLDKGDLYRDIYFSSGMHATELDWMSEGYLLLGGQNLVDLERRIVLWHYSHDAVAGLGKAYGEMGGALWFALTSPDRKERGLFRAALPHDEAKKVATGLDPDQLLALKPGAEVSLNIAAQGTPAEQQKIVQDLTAQLKDLGIGVVPQSRLVLYATTETGKTSEIEYRSFGRFSGGEKANVTEQISKLRLFEDNKVLWETVSVSGAPHMLQMKEGQSVQDALAPYQRPNLGFFSNVKLPQYVARQAEGGAYGASRLTPQGIQKAPLPTAQPAAGK